MGVTCPRHPNVKPYATGIFAGACQVCGHPIETKRDDLFGVPVDAEAEE